MFYIAIIPVSMYIFWEILHLNNQRKHDVSLYVFCQLRRRCIDYLRENSDTITRNDYISLRKLLFVINVTIKHYKEHKTIMFNYRLFILALRQTKDSYIDSEKITTNNPAIQVFHDELQSSIIKAFIAYTPLLKSEIIMSLLKAIAIIKIKSVNKYIDNVIEANKFIHHPSSLNDNIRHC